MLRPLEQFICDSCGEIIQSPDQGWFEWIDNRYVPGSGPGAHSFRICHHVTYSPWGHKEDGCYKHTREPGRLDNHLHHVLRNRMAELLWFIDMGIHHDRKYSGPNASNLREWSEVVRRLTIPYYEEARQYWAQAEEDDFFSDCNEIYIFTGEFLKAMIKKYSA